MLKENCLSFQMAIQSKWNEKNIRFLHANIQRPTISTYCIRRNHIYKCDVFEHTHSYTSKSIGMILVERCSKR